ncbi:hypothetical protein FA15DRAFT_674649 [Coprinopsis marcescibilis]|uniref:NACHT domain-containing protein n=1 Tax=Coprinopsis marcescibilis TaxID=230819 RepID=A0A5C3KGV5_COPMA|nr:hypothetical protein FA15DRAFT_674649 [Coprinopsis marcescibilis]
MSVFKNAVHTSISKSNITVVRLQGEGNMVNISPGVSNSEAMLILLKYVALDAIHDANARFDAPRCSKGTREAVQEDILTWTQLAIFRMDLPPEQLRLLLWMNGAAGTGKSAILQTIAEKADKYKPSLLAASFFFSYKYPARDGKLIPTLAYQLAVKIPAVKEHMAMAIANDLSIFSKSLEKQLDVLILEPIARVLEQDPSAAARWPKLIVIDGLDECKTNPAHHLHKQIPGEKDSGPEDEAQSTDDTRPAIDDGEQHQLEIIALLHKALITRRLPFRVALASRPDMPMRAFFSSGPASTCTRQIDLNVAYKPGYDIRLFLRSSFERIRAKYDIEFGWPGNQVIETLVNNASGQFVYADTVIKFVDGPSCDPTSNLDIIMEIAQSTVASQKLLAGTSIANPYAPLDVMYTAILNRCPAPRESVMAIQLFLRVSIQVGRMDGRLSASDFNTFLRYRSADVARVFGKLHSLVSVPPVGNSKTGYTLHHKSLQDFLYSRLRCGPDLYVPFEAVLERVSIQLLRLSGKFHIRIDPTELPCIHNCPCVLHVGGCVGSPQLLVSNDRGSGFIFFSNNHTCNGILRHGYPATLLQATLDSMDADSWALERVRQKQNGQLEHMYDFVHNTTFGCRWLRCSTICSRWRKAIRRECLRNNWEISPFSYRITRSPLFHPPISDVTSDETVPRARLRPFQGALR